MEYRQLGTSEVKVSVITFGAWAIGGRKWGGQDEGDAIAAIQTALEHGVTSIDTAPAYGLGRSEQIIAKAIHGKREQVQILTKYGIRWNGEQGTVCSGQADSAAQTIELYRDARKESVIYECEQSLKRLGTDYIDLYQCHHRDKSTPVGETMEAIDKLLKDGKILAAGVSNFTVEEIAAAREVVPLASNQPPYSMVNRGIENDLPARPGPNEQAGVLRYCRENNIGVIVYSPLQRGLLTGKITEDYKFKEDDHRAKNPFFRPENVRKVNAFLAEIRPIAESHNATLAQLVINWTIHRPGITAALVGARNPKQASENAQADEFRLTEDQTRRIDELLEQLNQDA